MTAEVLRDLREWGVTLKALDLICYIFRKGMDNPNYQITDEREIIVGARLINSDELYIVIERLFQRGLFDSGKRVFTFSLSEIEISALSRVAIIYLDLEHEEEKGFLKRKHDFACFVARKLEWETGIVAIVLDILAQKKLLDGLFDNFIGKEPFALTKQCCPRSFWELCRDTHLRQEIGLTECQQFCWLYKATRNLGFENIMDYKRFYLEHRPS